MNMGPYIKHLLFSGFIVLSCAGNQAADVRAEKEEQIQNHTETMHAVEHKIITDLYDYLGKTDANINMISTGILKQRKELATSADPKLTDAKKQELYKVLNQLDGIKNLIIEKRNLIEKLLIAYERQVNGIDSTAAAADTGAVSSPTIETDVQKNAQDIQNLIMQYQQVMKLMDIIRKTR